MAQNGYVVSARRFRPKTFAEIIGQPHLARALTNAIEGGKIGSGYIFSGPRGVGKTSAARILAKGLNCRKGPTSSPCLECEPCEAIAAGTFIDAIEIDGASNRGIDNIREIRENAKFTPLAGRYKVYIIDEAHQVTREAFNALLKILEEPPAHVIFIFATTALAKTPETILSRCQSFEFRAIARDQIKDRLAHIATESGVKFEPEALEVIAKRARGSMRDSQSIFDQAASFGAGEITLKGLEDILGAADRTTLIKTLEAAAAERLGELFEIVEFLSDRGADLILFAQDLAEMTRDVFAIKNLPAEKLKEFELSETHQRELALGKTLSDIDLFYWFDILDQTLNRMNLSFNPRVSLEMGLAKLGSKKGLVNLDGLIAHVESELDALDRREESLEPTAAPTIARGRAKSRSDRIERGDRADAMARDKSVGESKGAPRDLDAPEEARDSESEPSFEIVQEKPIAASAAFLEKFAEVFPSLAEMIDETNAFELGEAFIISAPSRFAYDQLDEARDEIARIINSTLAKKARLIIRLAGADSARSERREKENKARAIERSSSRKKKLLDDPLGARVATLFDAEITNVTLATDEEPEGSRAKRDERREGVDTRDAE